MIDWASIACGVHERTTFFSEETVVTACFHYIMVHANVCEMWFDGRVKAFDSVRCNMTHTSYKTGTQLFIFLIWSIEGTGSHVWSMKSCMKQRERERERHAHSMCVCIILRCIPPACLAARSTLLPGSPCIIRTEVEALLRSPRSAWYLMCFYMATLQVSTASRKWHPVTVREVASPKSTAHVGRSSRLRTTSCNVMQIIIAHRKSHEEPLLVILRYFAFLAAVGSLSKSNVRWRFSMLRLEEWGTVAGLKLSRLLETKWRLTDSWTWRERIVAKRKLRSKRPWY